MKQKSTAIGLWIVSIGYTCAMSLFLLMTVGSSMAVSFAGLSPIVGLVIACVGLLGCLMLLVAGGAVLVSAATVFCMRKFGRAGQAKPEESGKDAAAAATPAA